MYEKYLVKYLYIDNVDIINIPLHQNPDIEENLISSKKFNRSAFILKIEIIEVYAKLLE